MRKTKRCNQCWQVKPIGEFRGKADPTREVQDCLGCRSRYGNWASKSEDERVHARPPVTRTGDGHTVRFVEVSRNRKTGMIPVSTTDMRSCPSTCPHLDDGCYAGYGKTAMHWKNTADQGITWAEFCARVAALPEGTLWRHNEAGDLPGVGSRLDVPALRELVLANRGRKGFTFTHKWPGKLAALREANQGGFTVNLSADSMPEADKLAALGFPVALVLPSTSPTSGVRTPEGRTVVVCPAETKGLTCKDCRLCSHAGRKSIVGFLAHGQAQRRVSLRVVQDA